MLSTFEFSVSVLAIDAAVDLSGFAVAFGRMPSHLSKAGDTIVTPTGHRPGGRYATSRCLIKLGSHEDGTLRECFERATDLLERQREAVNAVLEMGGSVELFARWYPNGDTGEILPSALLARLGCLGVSLGLNVYGVPPTPAEE